MKHFLALAWLCLATSLMRAQSDLPIPTQIATAHTIYLANAGGSASGAKTAAVLYRSLLRQFNNLPGVRLVPSPRQADLEAAFAINVTYFDRIAFLQLSLRISDPTTNTLLWEFDLPISGAWREKNFVKNADESAADLRAQFTVLRQGKLPDDDGTQTTIQPKTESK